MGEPAASRARLYRMSGDLLHEWVSRLSSYAESSDQIEGDFFQ
jgi:hypothetical protein